MSRPHSFASATSSVLLSCPSQAAFQSRHVCLTPIPLGQVKAAVWIGEVNDCFDGGATVAFLKALKASHRGILQMPRAPRPDCRKLQ